MKRVAPSCDSSCPCRTVTTDPNCACGFTRCDPAGPYCEVSRLSREHVSLAARESAGSALSLSAQWIAEFDQIAAFHRGEAAKRVAEGESGSATADTTRTNRRKAEVPPGPPSRCIETIPTKGKTLAHQCRNRATKGVHCALHLKAEMPADWEQFPAALSDQPDSLPW